MKVNYTTALIVSTLLASGAAFAQGNGNTGGDSPNAGAVSSGAESGTGNAPATAGPVAGNGTGTSGTASTHKTHAKRHHHKAARKPVNDTTNMPGADASSDTKGQ